MQTDPSKWLVSIAGFAYDWIITREWTKILLAAFPIYLLLGVGGLVLWAGQGRQLELAKWYLELGNEEIAEWEESWAPVADGAGQRETPPDDTEAQSTGGETAGAPAADEGDLDSNERPTLSPFAETLFKKVQLLAPSDRSQYIIGTTLAQKEAMAQAEKILTKIAPSEGSAGYPPAHLVLTQLYSKRLNQDPRKYLPLLEHHYKQAAKWDRMPVESLLQASMLFRSQRKLDEAIQFQTLAAAKDPAMNVALGRLAIEAGNVKLAERVRRTAEDHFLKELEQEPKNISNRIQLAEVYLETNKIDVAGKYLFEGLEGVERPPELRRAQSQFFVIKFVRSVQTRGDKAKIELGFLDKAMRLDPSNPNVAEQVARLAAVGVRGTSEELIASLRKFLTEGKATLGTHRLLAQVYVARQDLKKAMEHYHQIVIRLPSSADAQNNFAYCLAVEEPERLEEALQHSSIAIKLNSSQRIRNADYFDTYAMILGLMDRNTEAVAAVEMAIEIEPSRVGFHQRAAELYEEIGNDEMALMHKTQAETLTRRQTAEANAGQ